MKLAFSVLTVVSLVCGSAFAAETKTKSSPAPAPRAAPAAPARQEAPRAAAPAPRQEAPAPRQEAPKQSAAPARQESHSTAPVSRATPAPRPASPAPRQEAPKAPAKQEEQKQPAQQQTKPAQQQTKPAQQHTKPAGNGNTQQTTKPAGNTKPATTTPAQTVTHTTQKPATHAPPAAKPAVTKPAQVKQAKVQETAAVKAKAPAAVAAKITAAGPGATAKVNKNNTITIRDAKGNTKVVDATTGKQRMSYNANTGKSVYTPPSGAKTVVSGNQTVRTAPGFKEVETRNANGTKNIQTTTRGTTVVKNYVSKTEYVTNKTVIVNNKTVIINDNRNYVVVNNGFGRVPVYRASWYGAPRSWVVGNIVVFDAFYAPTYWNGGRFVYFGNPYVCLGGCWADYSWYSDTYYAGYYIAPVSYPSVGDFMFDWYFQRQLENDRMMRLAAIQAEDQAAWDAEQAAYNNPAMNPGNSPMPADVRDLIIQQFETDVADTQNQVEPQAADMINANDGEGDGHIFGVDDPMSETTMVGDTQYSCQLGHGDFLVQDPNVAIDVEPVYQTDDDGNTVLDSDGNPVIETDDDGNAVNTTYVTMTVKKSKRGDCAEGLDVVVQLDTLQTMVDEEMSDAQAAMAQAVSLNMGQ